MALKRTATVRVEGFKELEKSLMELTKATAKNVVKRALLRAAQPIADLAEQLAPRRRGRLKASIDVGTKLSKRQASLARKERGTQAVRVGGVFRSAKSNYTEVYAGAGALRQSTTQEFGTEKNPPQPFMRPAWDAESHGALETLKRELKSEIDRAAARAARKSARMIRKVRTRA